jgi:hypothetical protein
MDKRFWWESQREIVHQKILQAGGTIILKWILKRDGMGWYGLDSFGSG